MKIKKPLLAAKFDPTKAQFPYIATPKIDGIRFLMVDSVAVSRTFKPIRNKHIQDLLSQYLPDGIDGELTSGDTFQSSTSAIMSIEGSPDFKVWVFDYVDPDKEEIDLYKERMHDLFDIEDQLLSQDPPFKYKFLSGGHIVRSLEEIERLETIYLSEGYEGLMLRDPMGTYKFGRSTVNENILLKVKQFVDDEAVLLDIQEKMNNENPAEKDAFGHTKRSSSLEGMVGADTAGTLLVRNKEGQEFSIGSGLNDALREELWNNKEEYIGKLVKFKYFAVGVKELPRHPVFLGFRDPDDL
jgi:DNA ligase 1